MIFAQSKGLKNFWQVELLRKEFLRHGVCKEAIEMGSQALKNTLRRRLLLWYRKHRRDLPWRKTRDPYAIWVSEVMLQQTQVATVIPYYENFLRRFPTLRHLAEAPEEQVLAAWAGLGYYRRARLLQAGAQQVLQRWEGKIPESRELLKSLPGIGDYTAGALASIAFGHPEPLVDGNVLRVFARLFALRGHPKSPVLFQEVWRRAQDLVPDTAPGDFNQALMELGATVCRPRVPACERCPVQGNCEAWRQGMPDSYPETPPLPKQVRLDRVVAVVQRGEAILLVKRKNPRWFQGMWELPHSYCDPGAADPGLLEDFLGEALGLGLVEMRALPPTRHGITHHRITSYAWQGQVRGKFRLGLGFEAMSFFPLSEVSHLALAAFDRKVLAAGGLFSYP